MNRRRVRKWLSPLSQVLWAGAVVLGALAIWIGANVELIPAPFDAHAPADDVRADYDSKYGAHDVVTYRFRDARGATHTGTSYAGAWDRRRLAPQIEYVAAEPSVSRVVGTSSRVLPRGALTLFVAPFVVALIALFGSWLDARRVARREEPEDPHARPAFRSLLILPTMAAILMAIALVVLLTPK